MNTTPCPISTTCLGDPLVHAFETATIGPTAFRHREHLYVAWCYLRSMSLEDALARYVSHLRKLTIALGVPEKFHATMTWAYVVLLHEAMQASQFGLSFDDLLTKNPGLLDHQSGLLHEHYDRAQLQSDEARRRFVLPRRS